MITDLAAIAPVLDFDFPNPLTIDLITSQIPSI
jgi:hypothetical protein